MQRPYLFQPDIHNRVLEVFGRLWRHCQAALIAVQLFCDTDRHLFGHSLFLNSEGRSNDFNAGLLELFHCLNHGTIKIDASAKLLANFNIKP